MLLKNVVQMPEPPQTRRRSAKDLIHASIKRYPCRVFLKALGAENTVTLIDHSRDMQILMHVDATYHLSFWWVRNNLVVFS